ncbi:hypothetical protein FACS1894218_1400 [Bacilli bacterium]|nr:hypothetical protein FACS1894218_1400 [Bacilli bacterium]
MKVNAGLTKIIVCSTVGFTIAGMAVVESSAIWMTVSNSLPIIHKYTDDLGNWNDVTLTD